ncbi:MAG TPA: ACT domain-containing protein [Candidatus Fimenecus excrementigallinarum]|uniref:ACT domain-containing protein n=1 Tax=Candidatus Fimenecus excrementigallinarum TaxID=2840816 RepID=A0A9D1LF64_9FIRM|nr:ACT domain-containing protein [Candidatus Fimenecus excrementigallinarum]
MTINQISVFLENRPGQLAEFTKLLEENQIDMRAMTIAESQDFGILRLVVDDPYKTVSVVKEAGYICAVTPVLAVEIPDKPGSLVGMLAKLGEGGVNLEYTYAFTARKKDAAYMALRVNDPEKAAKLLSEAAEARPLCQEDLGALFGEA